MARFQLLRRSLKCSSAGAGDSADLEFHLCYLVRHHTNLLFVLLQHALSAQRRHLLALYPRALALHLG